jgi:dolichyl-phosphate beta-glucosyltransferase
MYLSVIIPAYNEEHRIGKTLESVDAFLARQSYDYEILVVNDGSRDGTGALVRSYEAKIKNLRLVDNKINHGKGYGVRQGMLEATGDYRLFMDADNSTAVDHVEKFLPYFSEGYDIVIGSRRINGSDIAVKQSPLRDFLGGVFRFIVHIIVPLGVTDSQAGFKVFSRKAAEAIFPKQKIMRWAFDVEILALAKNMKFKIKETPIRWLNDAESKVKLSGMINMLLEVLEVRWNLINGNYK